MTTEKVTVPREVAEALDRIDSGRVTVDMALVFHTNDALIGENAPLQTLTIGDLARALIVGYEVEKTPEEKVREYYTEIAVKRDGAKFQDDVISAVRYEHMRMAIRETLDLLGIKIGGVND